MLIVIDFSGDDLRVMCYGVFFYIDLRFFMRVMIKMNGNLVKLEVKLFLW